ncbi:hypothetical protein J1614_008381 [Plenodomus biglobosus]|nr:hypothetical protein J1614_008381 [Plenodomus biglobosus]
MFALLFSSVGNQIEPAEQIPLAAPESSLQAKHNSLEAHLSPSIALYIFLRRDNSLVAITFIPYLAPESQRQFFLDNRHEVVRQLGQESFTQSLICKEIGEVVDARAWIEREERINNEVEACGATDEHGSHQDAASGVHDIGYKKNKCRTCDRRMKNKISAEAMEALDSVATPGNLVQLVVCLLQLLWHNTDRLQVVDMETESLALSSALTDVTPENVATLLPISHPSFTFYRHKVSSILYFIFHSPDSASVQERMKHTMAIPGLINVHAEDAGVHVDQKIEIHDPSELVFEEADERVGKFRSVYLRNKYKGTESVYNNLESDAHFFNDLR